MASLNLKPILLAVIFSAGPLAAAAPAGHITMSLDGTWEIGESEERGHSAD
jgi:hypothetical protein